MTTPLFRRIIRRETHSPRSVLAIVVALTLIAALAWAAVELVLHAAGQPPLLATPAQFASWAARPRLDQAVGVVVGCVVALCGLLLLVAALKPGRQSKHVLYRERLCAVVADDVIANAAARQASVAGSVDMDDAHVTVSRHRVLVRLSPEAGVPVDQSVVRERLDAELAEADFSPKLTTRVRIDTKTRRRR